MQKHVSYLFIFALFLVVCISGCGGGSSTTTPVANYTLPVFASYSSHLGGSVQGAELSATIGSKVTTFAGTPGSAGDTGIGFTNYTGNSAAMARFNQPNDITTNGTDFYVADYGNSLIRKIYKDPVSGEVKTRTLQCVDSVSRTTTIYFNHPTGITMDEHKLYVADSGSNTVRVIDLDSGSATTPYSVVTIGSATGLAGSVDSAERTTALFNQPFGITTDGVNIYVTDFNNATIRRIDKNNNYAVYTLAGASGTSGSTDGTQGGALFHLPTRITTNGPNLFVTDIYNHTIRQIVIATGVVTTLAGSSGPLVDTGKQDGIGPAAHFRQPNGITTDGTNLYVTDWYWGIIRKIVIATGNVTTLPLPGGSRLLGPLGITTDGVSLFVADTYFISEDTKTHIQTTTYSDSILKID